jgi:multidrug transporter EmrE-like cation transporter
VLSFSSSIWLSLFATWFEDVRRNAWKKVSHSRMRFCYYVLIVVLFVLPLVCFSLALLFRLLK